MPNQIASQSLPCQEQAGSPNQGAFSQQSQANHQRRRKGLIEHAMERKLRADLGMTYRISWHEGALQPLAISELDAPDFQRRFWSKVVRADGCWEWQGSKDRQGYGRIKAPRRRHNLKAHRVALMLSVGHDAPDKIVLHSCDNPSCCNPAHLSFGTHADNMQQMYERGRRTCPRPPAVIG